MVAAAPQQAEPQQRPKVQGQAAARRALNDGCADLD